jgi:uncharacterized protein (TIGR04141 family)
MLVSTATATYAFGGGIGHHKLLKNFEIEARFGIAVARRILRKLTDLKGLAQRDVNGSVHTLDRSFRRSYDPKLDIDNLHRMLRQLKGAFDKQSAEYAQIGASITASDSLTVNGSKDFTAMLAFLLKVDELRNSDGDGMQIPELRQISTRSERRLIDELTQSLAREILKFGDPQAGELLPDLFLDNFDVGYLPDRVVKYTVKYQRRSIEYETQAEVFRKLAEILNSAADTPNGEPSHARLDRVKVLLHLDDGQVSGPWKLATLMCGDVAHAGESYFIDGGHWYKADASYVAQLNAHLDRVTCFTPDQLGLREWNHANEADFNDAHRADGFVVLDRRFVRIEQEKGPIEFCDLLGEDHGQHRLIHVKNAAGAELRALFAQGAVAAELYVHDPEFRQNVHDGAVDMADTLNAQDMARLRALEQSDHGKVWIVYAIADGTPSHVPSAMNPPAVTRLLAGTLTLFAKVDLFTRVQHIRALGLQVGITRIRPYPRAPQYR